MAVVGLGGTAMSVMNESTTMTFGDFLGAGYNFLPAVLFFMGLAALVLGWLPKLGKVVYIYLGYSFSINYFGNLANLPEWFKNTAILSWIPRMPVADFDPTVWMVITIISIAMMILGYFGYNTRDRIESV